MKDLNALISRVKQEILACEAFLMYRDYDPNTGNKVLAHQQAMQRELRRLLRARAICN